MNPWSLPSVSTAKDQPSEGKALLSRPSFQVYYLGEGEASRQWLQQEQNTKARLCLSHVKAVASHVLARHPATKPLVWDDMLRDIPEDQLSGQPHGEGFRVPRGRERRCLQAHPTPQVETVVKLP